MKKNNKNLAKKLLKLEKEICTDIKYISKEDILLPKLSKSVKRYYDKLSDDSRKKTFLSYIVKMEERAELNFLSGLELRDEKITNDRGPKKCKNLADVINDCKKRQKEKQNPKKKFKGLLKRKDGLLMLINPESYDHTLLSRKKYRKYLSKLASKEKDINPVLDCTLKNFKHELLNNPKVNSSVTKAFFAKYMI